ncbi:PIF1-like helicase [Hirsutella rhossiliensis]|uniref:ATP-dependent DNA helicase n=1 Tax=Hirsutella rhossiliensis TaxID=111463 RepID=A0A9P8MZH5_9HYPO|nr:PIF1-like helicase domain-containing protein [Hirsutella rhossiliensis]KAH0965318.1 PIF1-like helicase domain-containing protein [Hirsutella rhossiliensis]
MVEEMLIARVHVHVKVLQVRGAQYKYRGHVVHFLRNVVCSRFPVPPPGYRDIVVPQGPVEEAMDEDPSDADASAIPNLQVTDTELNALQSRFLNGTPDPERMADLEYMPRSAQAHHQMPLPSIRRTPINEFNRSQPLLTLAFPTLYPDGKADFVEPRLRSITYQDYLGHAMRWRDGRFARHKTWPFVALNTLLRAQVRKRSDYFVRQRDSRRQPLTRADLEEAMAEPDEPEAQALIQSITRQAAVIRGTRPPGLFATVSAADYHWESLYRHMPRFDEWQAAPEAARIALSRQLLRDNAHIAAYHFHKRYTLLRAIVLKRKFNLTDFWVATQTWILTMIGPERFARIWGYYISAINPEPRRIQGARNDGQINHYNRLLTVAWLANTDVSPCTSLQQVIDYAAKYCSKSEKKSDSFAQIGKALMPRVKDHNPLISFTSKLLNQLVSERDYSKQEVCHLLLGLPLQEAFRYLRIDGDEVDEAPNVYEKDPSKWKQWQPGNVHGRPRQQWPDYCRAFSYCWQHHSHDDDHYGQPNLDILGHRDIDVNYDWSRHVGHFQAQNPTQILLHVDGGGGTAALPNPSPICRVAPTGVASNQIQGSTIHSLLRLLWVVLYRPSPTDAAALQSRLRHVKYLVIDEKSMLGLEQLARIDSRLRQAFPQRKVEFFGGVSVLLVGDFFQLPPVRQKPLYSTRTGLSSLERKGQVAYRLFDRTVFLITVQRQVGDDQAQFRQALQELREVKLSITSWNLLSNRARVNEYNHEHMVHLNAPAIQVEAKNQGKGAGQAPSDNAGNLSNKFPVAKGARGTVYDIAWNAGADPLEDPPAVIMVDFDSYDGPSYLTTNEGRKISPILPSLTKDQIVTDLASRDFQAGISYVAVSRVTSLQGLLLEAPFDRQSLYNHAPTEGMKMRLADQKRRQAQQLTDAPYPPLYLD